MKASRVVAIRAPNPSAMTLTGTNTYLLEAGHGAAIVIDPGPFIERHVAAILAAAQARDVRIAAILVTHGHPDHAPAAQPLAQRTGAPVYAHANAPFPHDVTLHDGEEVAIEDVVLCAVDAPGHARDHLVFWFPGEAALFTGDTVIGEGTVLIAPPDGEMRAYLQTLRRLRDNFPEAQRIYGGHGDPVDAPRAKLDAYLAHRLAREAQVIAQLATGPQTIAQLVAKMYPELTPVLRPAAARQILAHLIALEQDGRVRERSLDRAATAQERALLSAELALDAPLDIRVYELDAPS
ncbi:MAG TPA: MBL fold metallo-hydrolase [Candidatus Acidoferrales bacterium]|nr:MBL fold metallo-hydrolase [Candidatus Acidoferrales bacterium]